MWVCAGVSGVYVCVWVGVAAGNQAGMNFVSWGYGGSDFISIDYH